MFLPGRSPDRSSDQDLTESASQYLPLRVARRASPRVRMLFMAASASSGRGLFSHDKLRFRDSMYL